MRTIRSLLWIGSGRGLTRSGMTEAPELDVTWVPDLDEALLLPTVRFDAVLAEVDAPEALEAALPELDRFAERRGILVVTDEKAADHADSLLAMGIGAVFVVDRTRVGRGFVTEVNETLDELLAKRSAKANEDSTREAREDSGGVAVNRASDTAEGGDDDSDEPPRVIGRSEAMQDVSRLVDLAASSPSTSSRS